MFEYESLDAAGVLTALDAGQRQIQTEECRQLALAAHWADLHVAAGVTDPRERARPSGGAGTPAVSEFTATEFGAVLGTTTASAWLLIADAVDLRHRLPRLWSAVGDGRVRAWKARKVAQATRHLPLPAAAAVDAAVADAIAGLAWGRFCRLLDAEIMHADPVLARNREEAWAAERFVRVSRAEGGLATVVARAAAGEAVWFEALVARIAEILAADGDEDPAQIRRSKAIGIIAQPALALQLLVDHAAPDDHPVAAGHGDETDDHRSLAVTAAAQDRILDAAGVPRSESVGTRHAWARLVRAAQPRVRLYVHLTDQALTARDDGGAAGVARVEGHGPMGSHTVREWLGRVDTRITVTPVVDPLLDAGAVAPVDGWEVPHRMREAVQLLQPAEVFPFGTADSRRTDLDHTVPFRPPSRGGPPGQTRPGNLGPLSRAHHRAKTFGRWRLRQPERGRYLWRSPHGWTFLVTAAGTQPLGTGRFADEVWASACRSPDVEGAA